MLKGLHDSPKAMWCLMAGAFMLIVMSGAFMLIVHHASMHALRVDDVARLPNVIGQRVEIQGVYSRVDKGGVWVQCGAEMILLDDRFGQIGIAAGDRVRISGVLWKWNPPAIHSKSSSAVQGPSNAFFYFTDESMARE